MAFIREEIYRVQDARSVRKYPSIYIDDAPNAYFLPSDLASAAIISSSANLSDEADDHMLDILPLT